MLSNQNTQLTLMLERSGTPQLSQGLSQKLAITEEITRAHPSSTRHSRPRTSISLSRSGVEAAELSSLQARVIYTFPEHSFLKMTSMTMQLRAPPGRAAALQRHREVSMARSAVPTAATRRKRVSGKQTRCLVGATFDDYGTGPSAVGLLTQAATLVAVTAGAWWAARLASQQESAEPRQECGVCNGTGLVPCICQRWSDSDVGCATCNGRGLMACNSCGGGGTAVPITAKLISRRNTTDLSEYTRQ